MFLIWITGFMLISAGVGHCPRRCHCNNYKTMCTLARLNSLPTGLLNSTEFVKIELDSIIQLNSSIIADTGLFSLRQLVLINVQLQEIQPGTFQKVNLLESLTITHNNISNLKPDSFKFLHNLYFLDLSNNNISNLNSGSFSGLVNIRHLYLTRNKIDFFPTDIFQDMKNSSNCDTIKTRAILDISGNSKECRVANGVFQNICTFTHFNLGAISTESITKYSFAGLTRAVELTISVMYPNSRSVNRITNFLNASSSLVHLKITSGKIEDIERNAFEKLKFLKSLNLAANLIYKIRRSMFKGLELLKVLDLSANVIFTLKTGVFQYVRNLETLEMQSCKIKKIEPGAFSGMTELRTLGLISNNIVMLKNNTFDGLAKLRELKLDANKIKTIERGAFLGLRSLKSISNDVQDRFYLSYNDIHGKSTYKITKLEVTFETLSRLDKLELRGSVKSLQGIQVLQFLRLYIDGTSTNLQKELQALLEPVKNVTYIMLTLVAINSTETLETLSEFQISFLHIQVSNLSVIKNNSISLSNLKYLAIENCGTLKIEKDAFHQVKLLTELEIFLNERLKIEPSSFSGLDNLKSLNLCENQISAIEEGTFLGLGNLKTLDLHENNISSLSRRIFHGLEKIEKINLRFNKLKEIDMGVFGAVCEIEFELSCKNASISSPYCNATNALKTLKYLDLARNRINYIHPHAFISCINLHELDISHNTLLTLDNPFLYTPALRILYMNNCNVTNIPNNTFECAPFLSKIWLSINNTKFNITPLLSLTKLQSIHIYTVNSIARNCSFYEPWLWFHMHKVSYYIEQNNHTCNANQKIKDGNTLLNLNCNFTFQFNKRVHNISSIMNENLFFIQYIEPVVLIIILILGLALNGFLLFISLCCSDMRKIQNACIVQLLTVDILSLVLNLPLSYWDVINIKWEFSDTMCKIYILSKDIMMGASVLSIIALSLERYLVSRIFNNLQKLCDVPRKVPTIWILMMTWISSIVISLPSYLSATVDVRCLYCPSGNQDYIKRVWTFQLIIYCLLPAITITYLNVMTSRFIRRSAHNMPGEIKNNYITQNKKIVANIMLVLVSVFVLTHAPNFILRVLTAWSVLKMENLFLVSFFSFCLFLCNTICNPAAVLIMSSKYKSHFLRYFLCITNQKNVSSGSNLKRVHAVKRRHSEYSQKESTENCSTIYDENNVQAYTTSRDVRNIKQPQRQYFTRLRKCYVGKYNQFTEIVQPMEIQAQEGNNETSSYASQDDFKIIQQARMERLTKLQKRFM